MNHEGEFSVVINDRHYTVKTAKLLGFDIRALSGVPALHELIMEGEGNLQDTLLRDEDCIDLGAGRVPVIFSRPPAMQG